MSELQVAAADVAKAKKYTDIFPNHDPAALKKIWQRLARILHPDQYAGPDKTVANEAYKRLSDLYRQAKDPKPVTIHTKRAVHVVKDKLADGDLCAMYQTATTDEHGSVTGLLKVARSARDNDLLAAEAKALKTLHAVDDTLTRHYPVLLDTFVYHEGRRRANVQAWQADCLNVWQLRGRFPGGVDPRQVAWIWRRLLMAVAFAHDQNVLHGAVLPPHILILPSHHGVILVDWCYSVSDSKSTTSRIKATVPGYRDWYPEEVINKQPPSQATDIVMAARSMIYLLGGDPVTGRQLSDRVPRKMRAWFKGCLQVKQSMRPDNAGKLLAEFDELLVDLKEPYYPRRWVDFVVPTGAAT